MKKLAWIIFVFFALVIGIYPVAYFLFDMSQGLLASKSDELKRSMFWQTGFYLHISFGALAMLSGWSQFSTKIRNRNLTLHRRLGVVYLLSVLISGMAGFYIALHATGGLVAMAGFSGLAIAWLFSSGTAYYKIRQSSIDEHQYWMIRSYALCFAAVTLRIWLPLFQFGFAMDFFPAYRIIAWLCWVPNLLVAEMIIRNLKTRKSLALK